MARARLGRSARTDTPEGSRSVPRPGVAVSSCLRRALRSELEVVWSSWRRVWVEGRGLEGRRVVALIDSARVVVAGPGTLIPPLGASSPGLGAPIPEPAPFPASHPFWFPRRHPEVVVRRRVRPTSALSRPIARGRGSTGRGLCVLHEGPTYLEHPRPSSSRFPPPCSGRWRHQITASNGNQDRPTRRTSGSGSKGAPPGAAAGGILRVR